MDQPLHLVVHPQPGEAGRPRAVLFVERKDARGLTLVEARASRAAWQKHMARPPLARFGRAGAPLAASRIA